MCKYSLVSKNIAKIETQKTIAVPKSGCIKIKKIGTANNAPKYNICNNNKENKAHIYESRKKQCKIDRNARMKLLVVWFFHKIR